jgi:hypothetical protein
MRCRTKLETWVLRSKNLVEEIKNPDKGGDMAHERERDPT